MKRRDFVKHLVIAGAVVALPLKGKMSRTQGMGGTFTMACSGRVSRPIPWNATQDELDEALKEIGFTAGAVRIR